MEQAWGEVAHASQRDQSASCASGKGIGRRLRLLQTELAAHSAGPVQVQPRRSPFSGLTCTVEIPRVPREKKNGSEVVIWGCEVLMFRLQVELGFTLGFEACPCQYCANIVPMLCQF